MQASVCDRLDALERSQSSSVNFHNEQHGKHSESLEAVRARLEALRGEHTDYWDAAHAKMEQLHGTLAEQLQGLHSRHGELHERLQVLHGTHGQLHDRLQSHEEHRLESHA